MPACGSLSPVMQINHVGGEIRIGTVGGDVIMDLNGPASVHTLSHREFPDWEEIRAQPASSDAEEGAEVLVAAAGELLFTGEGGINTPGFPLFEKMSIPTPSTPPIPSSPMVETRAEHAAREQTPAASGTSEDETLKVLRMVQDGKISPEEGDILLDALSK